jgi:hypothetical protein
MKLIDKAIPTEFLEMLPEGFLFLNKHGKRFLVVEEVTCPAGCSLMDPAVKIHGEASIKMQIESGDAGGLMFVDAFWGGHEKLYGFIPKPGIVSAACPSCSRSLIVQRECPEGCCDRCIVLALPGENKIFVCAQLGCPGHHLHIAQMPESIIAQVDDINFSHEGIRDTNYFSAPSDDIFRGI